MDEIVWSFLHAFFGHQLFFVKLFAWAETGVGDFDVYIRCVAGKLDQVSGKGVDLYRGSHVQDEDLASFGVGSCLEDKAYGLRDSHKVADDVRMCDGDRAAFFDLALEQRDHTSVAAENVSESYSYEFCAGSCFRCMVCTYICLTFVVVKCIQGILSVSAKSWQPVGVSVVADHVHALDYHFAESFAGAHDVGRVYSLIGTDQHKALAAVHHCRICSLIGSYHIVLDCLTGAVLHQRYVLMCGCMIYDLRLIGFKYPVDPFAVTDGADQYLQVQVRITGLQLLLNVVSVIFINVENHQKLWLMTCDLTAELASDRTAASCYQDPFSLQILKDL